MLAHQRELSERIANFSFDDGGEELTFAARLARENGWSKGFAKRAIEEYRRFAFLAICAGHTVTPSDAVDQVWHLHLTYTRSYWDRFCGEVLLQPLHHGPTKGGAIESQRYLALYERTLASYRQYFEAEPPADVWPKAEIRFGEDTRQVRVNTARHWVIRKPRWSRRSAVALAALPIAGFVPLGAGVSQGAIVIFLIVLFLFMIYRIVAMFYGGGGGGSNNPGGCGASGCAGDSGCGSGCGGGCGGCGGG